MSIPQPVPSEAQLAAGRAPILCIYHGNCADGFGAAWVVRKFYQEKYPELTIDFHAGVYGQEPPNVAGKNVIMVDFSYKRPVIDMMLGVCESLLILDHHKTAEADLKDIQNPKCNVIFDMTRSGALIAWNTFFPERPALELIQIISDRDLWQFKLPLTREIQAGLFSYPYDFKKWDTLMQMPVTTLAADGDAIERKHFKDIHELLKVTKRWMKIGGYWIPAANLPYTMSSDAGHIMSQTHSDCSFAACYWDIPDGSVVFSLRSRDGGGDVSEIAKCYGGGGHAHAAGFTVRRHYMQENFEVSDDKIEEAKTANAANGGNNT